MKELGSCKKCGESKEDHAYLQFNNEPKIIWCNNTNYTQKFEPVDNLTYIEEVVKEKGLM